MGGDHPGLKLIEAIEEEAFRWYLRGDSLPDEFSLSLTPGAYADMQAYFNRNGEWPYETRKMRLETGLFTVSVNDQQADPFVITEKA